MYGDHVLRETYAEIKDVEEEHVTMYESLIDPTESMWEKFLIHEFTEVCNYYTCMEDEPDDRIKKIWELFVDIELGHLQAAASLFCKYESVIQRKLSAAKSLFLADSRVRRLMYKKFLKKKLINVWNLRVSLLQ